MQRVITPVLILLMVLAAAISADQPDAKSPADQAAEVAQQFASRDAKVRDAAVQRLIMLGAASIEPVTEAAFGSDPESGIRAIHVLEALDLVDDPATHEPAEKALRRIVAEGQMHAVQRAREVLNRHGPLRQDRAAAAIGKLGGQIAFDNSLQFTGTLGEPTSCRIVLDRKWTGGDAGLWHLVRLEGLRAVYLIRGHQVSQQALDEFRMLRPDVALPERGSAFLGVAPGIDTFGCIIQQVSPGSAAERGLLARGDVVIEMAGKLVRTGDELINVVAEHEPGDKLRIVFLRDVRDLVRRSYREELIELLNDPEADSVLLPVAMLHTMRMEVEVTLDEWKLDATK